MPLATAYTEAELATFMLDELGTRMAAALGWTNQASIQAAINQAVRDTGLADIALVTGVSAAGQLEAFARRAVWRRAVAHLAVQHDFESDGQSFKRSQLLTNAQKALALAEAEAGHYDTNDLVVGVTTIQYPNDPYSHTVLDEPQL